ncbi:MAG TPA: hypothetical protein PLI86_10945 [bacterium]|jgi:hypothetical protein|nr:hypothetical protein [bacterium]
MKWLMAALVVAMLFTVMLLPAECHARGFFSFFNPEVEVPVEVKPVNSDIIGGMKATVTLGSLGSVITAHLALVIMGFLLYAAIRRMGEGYHARMIGLQERLSAERIEKRRLRNELKSGPLGTVITWDALANKHEERKAERKR